jgi:cytochrome c-type protein NapC
MEASKIIAVMTGIAAGLALLVAVWPTPTRDRGGKILTFLALFILPAVAGITGSWRHLEQSKQTDFCLSCHSMSEHGRSLFIDDPGFLPAAHYQNNRVPRDRACYTCHKDYTMYGDLSAKWRGLRHVYVQYLGNRPEPAKIQLYSPYNNRECLYCHAGARSFEEASPHNREPGAIAAMKSNTKSCLSSKCHEFAHNVESINDFSVWKAEDNGTRED